MAFFTESTQKVRVKKTMSISLNRLNLVDYVVNGGINKTFGVDSLDDLERVFGQPCHIEQYKKLIVFLYYAEMGKLEIAFSQKDNRLVYNLIDLYEMPPEFVSLSRLNIETRFFKWGNKKDFVLEELKSLNLNVTEISAEKIRLSNGINLLFVDDLLVSISGSQSS
jgi:hypothetical protein